MIQRLLVFWFIGFVGSFSARAQTIDPTLTITSLRQPVEVRAAIQQADGKHVVLGLFTTAEGQPSGGLARYNLNHTADQAFNANVAGLRGTLQNVRQLPSGKLLLIGPDSLRLGGVSRRNLLRLNADGTPDPSFDAVFAVPTTVRRLATAVQPDGKILVGGDFQVFNGTLANRLVRLLPDGAVDAGFSCAAPLNGPVLKILVQPDGKVLVGGGFSTPRRIVRLEATGAVDNTFSSPLTNAFASPLTGLDFIGLQPDGKIIIGGMSMNVSAGVVRRIARLLPSGTLDNTFQTPNTTDYSAGIQNPYDASEVAVLPDGRIVLSGSTGTEYYRVPLHGFICLTASGAVSSSFDNIFLPDERFPGVSVTITSLFRQVNGQWLVAGDDQLVANQRSYVALLNADGSHDASFAPTLLGPGYVTSVVQQPDAKLLIGGAFDEINGARVGHLARLHPNGALDTAFCRLSRMRYEVNQVALTTGGKVLAASWYGKGLVRFLPGGGPDAGFTAATNATETGVYRMQLQPDGRVIVITGASAVRRMLADGQIDFSFTPYTNGSLSVLALQADGKLLLGGLLDLDQISTQYTRGLIRLLPDGTRDASFTELADPYRFRVTDIGFQSTGKIVVSGSAAAGGNRLIRLLPATGQPDPTFTPLPVGQAYDGAMALSIQPNDRILTMTYAYYGTGGTLVRLLPDGAPDNSFAAVPIARAAYSTISQLDGKLVVAGDFSSVAGTARAGLVRLEAANVLHAADKRPAAQVAAWPVPAHNVLRLQLPAAPTAVTLLNVQGQAVVRQTCPAATTSLDLRHLPAGVYLLRVDYAEGPVTRRVVVE
ncbi:T9SS type A sorting domain-containing protein [Hymenobacter sp. 15J16-1T3B]|uniref:T9SS type A sorting domain-containing protein n=1 Tax=Hymenobacter sp. 15J16-1T3B TaxID=2886941 RepID=UPI001D0F788F|nr:T9SS type A sorting domain-containing protein [Hymenobacter sp. 15J16-1T3B]MCC3155829.1 T9SS type A sorting domain-containing protein [Hymenobacter sp. 15J16-1T3B]